MKDDQDIPTASPRSPQPANADIFSLSLATVASTKYKTEKPAKTWKHICLKGGHDRGFAFIKRFYKDKQKAILQ